MFFQECEASRLLARRQRIGYVKIVKAERHTLVFAVIVMRVAARIICFASRANFCGKVNSGVVAFAVVLTGAANGDFAECHPFQGVGVG